jgi:superfamily I DNA/RNA helicase
LGGLDQPAGSRTKSITVFGDDDQSIFSFKPSKKEIFEDLARLLPDAIVSNLTESFRQKSQPLLDSLRRFISQGRNRLEAKSTAFSKLITVREQKSVFDDDEEPYYPQVEAESGADVMDVRSDQGVSVNIHHSEEAEVSSIIQSIENILRLGLNRRNQEHEDADDAKDLFPDDISPLEARLRSRRLPSICVVAKTRKMASDLYQSLRSRGLPVSVNTMQLKESPEIKFLMNFLRILARPTAASDALYELIAGSSGPYSLPPKSLGAVTEATMTTQRPLRTVLELFIKQDAKEKSEQQARKRVHLLLADLDFFERQMKTKSTTQVLYGVLKRTQLLQAARNPNSTEDEDVSRHLGSFLKICSDLETKMKILRVVDVLPALEHLLERSSTPQTSGSAATRAGGDVITQEEEPGFVKVLTPWSLASSEFDYIFIPRCSEDVYPGNVSADMVASMLASVVAIATKRAVTGGNVSHSALEEQRRVFYVCLSRARKHVFLSYSSTKPSGQLTKTSRFIGQTVSQFSGEVAQAGRLAERAAAALRVMQRQGSSSESKSHEKSARSLFGQKDRKYLVQHEPKTSIDFKTMTSSFLRCPMQYYLEHIVNLPLTNKTTYQNFQIALASARDLLTSRRAAHQRPDLNETVSHFSSVWKKEIQSVSDSSIPADVYEAGMTILEAWVDMDLDLGLEAVEVPFRLDLSHIPAQSVDPQEMAAASVPVVGMIDRVYFGRRVRTFLCSPAEVAPRTSRELLDVAKVLSLAYLHVYHVPPTIVTVETVNKDFELQKTEFRPTADDVRQVEPNLAAVSAKIAAGIFQANSNNTVCRRCAFKSSCPASSSKPTSRTATRPR